VIEPVQARRSYDGRLRRQGADETRQRIVDAGCALFEGSPIRDWQGLTVRAVAQRAGVNERTVYRHFGNERGMRDAIMRCLEAQAGIELAELGLGDIADATARIIEKVAAHPSEQQSALDDTLRQTSQRQREALLRAVAQVRPEWSASDRQVAAAMFDLLWSVGAYERLATDWQLDRDQVVKGIGWVITLIEQAVRDGRPPSI
jgi:AcrR family transcriptional regulator